MGAIDSFLERDAAVEAAATCDVIVLCGPVLSILDWIERLAPVLGERQLVTDVGSTKAQIAELAAKLGYNQPGKARFLPGHPMAGKEQGGAALAEATLFQNAMWLFTPLDATATALEAKWRAWVKKFGARTMDLDAARHDEICAWVSHLPQMLSTALAALLEETFSGDPVRREEIAAIGGRALQGDDAAGRESVQHVARYCALEHRADCADAACAGAAAGACAGESADAGAEGRVSPGERVPEAARFIGRAFSPRWSL
jgi:prephenate dehydrogenase